MLMGGQVVFPINDGVAVVSAIFAAKDIKKDTKQLRSLVEEMKQK